MLSNLEKLVTSLPYTGKHKYVMNHVQSTLPPAAVVLVLSLQHPHLCGTHGCAPSVPQPQDPCGRGPFPVGKGSKKPLLHFQSCVVVLREEHSVCSDQPALQREPTAFKKRAVLPVLWVKVLNFMLGFLFLNQVSPFWQSQAPHVRWRLTVMEGQLKVTPPFPRY